MIKNDNQYKMTNIAVWFDNYVNTYTSVIFNQPDWTVENCQYITQKYSEDKDHVKIRTLYALMLIKGYESYRNPDLACELLLQGSRKKNLDDLYLLGRFYMLKEQSGEKQDVILGEKYLRVAADFGNHYAYLMLVNMQKNDE